MAERKKIYAEVQRLVAEDQPMTYLCYRKNAVVVNKRVANTKFVDILGSNDGILDWTLTK
jgi:ABC-type transport system substrate-binding protein